ncbi:hypothetical protein PTSG_03409 [Salpingoeca rosetta]|uniref:Fibronectin type-III domain-containing protein n=1 Tax=Salpingoeca rosetta (strain ATCC 50818 / BSB-021) TaxID=946362 RepID=F2U542_SALR5|nr:uncharacterized protein PTSG_03409 [Salpingoeca rosetta]EGD82758.1 hypothetical protein PTSG_03409 [Salpingoeca rosetta]|eukprot:XP_004995994.1 hypothetical protein PTSG_03409 [Salpingoeca rosetta]
MVTGCALLLVVVAVVVAAATATATAGALRVGDRPRHGAVLSGKTVCFDVAGLRPATSYEARVSYVGVVPSLFTLTFACGKDAEEHDSFSPEPASLGVVLADQGDDTAVVDHTGSRRVQRLQQQQQQRQQRQQQQQQQRRQLLDTSKIIFRTDVKGAPISPGAGGCSTLCVTGEYASVPMYRHQRDGEPVLRFTLVVEENVVFGLVPTSVVWLIPTILVLVALVQLLIVPRLHTHILRQYRC